LTLRERSTLQLNKYQRTPLVACSVCSHAVHSCVDGKLKLLGKFDILTRLAQTEIDQILKGDDPEKWSIKRHFSNEKIYIGYLDVRCICDPLYRHGHFVTFVLCPEYWIILDPPTDESVIDPIGHEHVKNVIKKTYKLKGIEVPNLPSYKQFKRICFKKDSPLLPIGFVVLLLFLRLVILYLDVSFLTK